MIRRPKLHMLPVSSLHVDSYAQRSFSPNWAKALARDWSEDEVGVFRVSRRDDGLDYVFDGQHRRAALLELGKDSDLVPCLVYEGLTLAEEARLFVAYNVKTRRPNPIDAFRLAVVGEDPDAVEIQKVLEDHGLKVEFAQGPRTIAAVSALRWLHQTGGVKLLDLTLDVLEAAWGPDNRDARDGSLLKGLGWLLHHHTRELNLDSLADKLGKHSSPGVLMGTARTYRTATQRSLWLETAHVIVNVYNHGRSSRRIAL